MAKQVIWSLKAHEDRKMILAYWHKRNQSVLYSKKLNQLFKEAVKLISRFPQIGRATDMKNVRIKIVREYLLVYEETPNHIHILAIWDGRQDPEKFEKFF